MAILNFKGFISFPQIFTPDYVRNAMGKPASDRKRYTCDIMIPAGDAQIGIIQQHQDAAIQNSYPSGAPADLRVPFLAYEKKYQGKSYYDPKFNGWYVLSLSAKEEDKPKVVDANMQTIADPGQVYPGAEVIVACGITGYTDGKGGIGCWLNGVMVTGKESPFGRFDNRPTTEQMFANVTQGQAVTQSETNVTAGQGQPASSVPSPSAPPPAPPATAEKVMTAKANGGTYEQFVANGWTDTMLVEQGYMLPGGVTTSF
jgi:cell division septation protein DedD